MNILTIDQLRERKYSCELKIEEKVKAEEKFTSYIASYNSDGLKIYGYLVVPKVVTSHQSLVTSKKSLIIFCHGRIEPKEYLPERQYARHCEYLGEQGFVVFKPDYRGHGDSQGESESIFESGYAIDVLNAISALSKPDYFASFGAGAMTINDKNIGIMGHSLGGNIALKVMEVNTNVKAGVIWGGAVAGYDEILSRWGKNNSLRLVAEKLIEEHGEPKTNPEFWKSISPINFVDYINGSVLIQHGAKDESVSVSQAEQLGQRLKQTANEVEIIVYQDGGHNFEGDLWQEAIDEAVRFFKS